MGKYMRKGKVSGEVAVMEVPGGALLGVRTRSRTLALQRAQRPQDKGGDAAEDAAAAGEYRSTRETTPCSLIRNPEIISTPGSTTKSKTSNSMTSRRRMETSVCRFIPSSHGMEEFSAAEKQEHHSFRPQLPCHFTTY